MRDRIFNRLACSADPIVCVGAYADAIDREISALFSPILGRFDAENRISLVAVGGYGRREMCPFSDVDMMILYGEGAATSIINALERAVWDAGYLVGFAARTPKECLRILGDDYITDCALLESRLIFGNRHLFDHYCGQILQPYFSKNRHPFLKEMHRAVSSSIDSPIDSLYRIEPDVKNGIATLRDCHRVFWAEKVAQQSIRMPLPTKFHYLNRRDQHHLQTAYSFLMKIRIELHMQCKRRLDILEVEYQHKLAASLGYPDNAPGALMSEFYRSVSEIKQCLLSFVEHVYREENLFKTVRSALASFPVAYGLQLIDGILYLRKKEKCTYERNALWTLNVFTTALTCMAWLSMGVRSALRDTVVRCSPHDYRAPECEIAFCHILSDKQHAGGILQLMHETGILERVLPEFAPLTCRVEYDTYHEYTVDQHTLIAVRAFDECDNDAIGMVRLVFKKIPDYRVFRLALLLHDAGKAMEGDHCRNGAILAKNAAVRLGFSENEANQVEFLVYHHLDMSDLSLHSEADEQALRAFAEKLGTVEMLDMLYLLTILDIRHVSPRTMTGWKTVQLSEIYSAAERLLANGTIDAKPLSGNRLTEYIAETLPEDRLFHSAWLSMLGNDPMQLHTEPFSGFYRITIVTNDRLMLLSDIAACFIAAGLQIVSAQIYSVDDGKVVDVFDVEHEAITTVSFDERLRRFSNFWNVITTKKTTSREIVRKKFSSYPRKKRRQVIATPTIEINNADSRTSTIIEVRAPDRFGLLFTVVNALSMFSINIRSARIATAMDSALDRFFVTTAQGEKIVDEDRLNSIRNAVLTNLAEWN